jgi:putative endonuclease
MGAQAESGLRAYQGHDTLEAAMQRERRIKSWKRAWKIELIEKENPQWVDLYPGLSM